MTCDWHRHTTWVSDVSFFLLAYDWSFCSDGFIRLPTSLNIDEYSIIIYIGISSYIGMSLLSWWLPWIWICRANLDAAKTWNGLHALCLKHEHRVRARPQMWPKWDCFSHDLQLHWGSVGTWVRHVMQGLCRCAVVLFVVASNQILGQAPVCTDSGYNRGSSSLLDGSAGLVVMWNNGWNSISGVCRVFGCHVWGWKRWHAERCQN